MKINAYKSCMAVALVWTAVMLNVPASTLVGGNYDVTATTTYLDGGASPTYSGPTEQTADITTDPNPNDFSITNTVTTGPTGNTLTATSALSYSFSIADQVNILGTGTASIAAPVINNAVDYMIGNAEIMFTLDFSAEANQTIYGTFTGLSDNANVNLTDLADGVVFSLTSEGTASGLLVAGHTYEVFVDIASGGSLSNGELSTGNQGPVEFSLSTQAPVTAPEPSSLMLLLAGLACLSFWKIRQRA